MAANDLRGGNLNSPETCETVSKPTKSHGARATIPATWPRSTPPSGAKAGPIDASPPRWRSSAAPKQTRMHSAKRSPSAVWTGRETFRQQHAAAATAIAAEEIRMCTRPTCRPHTE